MNYFNFNQQNPNQIRQLFPNYSQPQPQKQSFNPIQFQQMIPSLDKNMLVNLVQSARQQGISDAEIEQGLNFILNFKK